MHSVSNPGGLGPTVPGQITPGKHIGEINYERNDFGILCIAQIIVGANVFTGAIDK